MLVSLTSGNPSRLTVPATVIIPAGQTSVPLPLTMIDNILLDGTEPVNINAVASGYFAANAIVNVHDDETATLTVSLPSGATKGAGTVSGTITASAAPTRATSPFSFPPATPVEPPCL